MSSSISNDQQMIVIAGGQPLTAQPQAGCPHALQLSIRTQSCADERITLDGIIMELSKIRFLHVTAVTGLATGDQVVAVVELIIGVPGG